MTIANGPGSEDWDEVDGQLSARKVKCTTQKMHCRKGDISTCRDLVRIKDSAGIGYNQPASPHQGLRRFEGFGGTPTAGTFSTEPCDVEAMVLGSSWVSFYGSTFTVLYRDCLCSKYSLGWPNSCCGKSWQLDSNTWVGEIQVMEVRGQVGDEGVCWLCEGMADHALPTTPGTLKTNVFRTLQELADERVLWEADWGRSVPALPGGDVSGDRVNPKAKKMALD
eukprot:344846-Amphidinium_carterae.4